MQEMRVRVGAVELQLREYGGAGEAIIFLHYGGANLMIWQQALPWFQDQYRLVLLDLRGHGKSDKPESGYHIDEMARDVVGIMQHLGLQRVHIIGSSLGAEVGLSLAANHPKRVISLVCDGALSSEYGPYSTWEGSQADFEAHVTRQLEKMRATPETILPSVDALVDQARATFEKFGWWNEYFEATERYGACRLGEGQYTRAFQKQARQDYMKHYFHYRFEKYYRKVTCPLLMIPGEEAWASEREKTIMQGLRALTRQGQIVAVSGWEHPYGWLIDPEGVCKAILKFLGSAVE